MPDADGLEVIQSVRQILPDAHNLAMTVGDQMLDAAFCLHLAKSMGAHGFILKPFSAEQFIGELKNVLPVEPRLAS